MGFNSVDPLDHSRSAARRSLAKPGQAVRVADRLRPARLAWRGSLVLLVCACGHVPEAVPGRKAGLVSLGLPPPVRWNEQLRPRLLALTIGLDQFADPAWPALQFARQDAFALAQQLRDPAVGRFDTVTLLHEPAQTTRRGILDGLHALHRQNLQAADTVVVYISSHGTLARDEAGVLRRYLVTQDTRADAVTRTALSVDELRQTFGQLRSQRKVLILATCHSGQGKSLLTAPVARDLEGIKGAFFVPPLEAVSQASVIIGVCSFGETAREDQRLGHDIYTYFLLEALTQGDRNQDGAVTVTEAHEHARSRTYYFTEGQQRPYVESDILGEDPIILAGRVVRPGQPSLFSFSPLLEGLKLLLNGQEKGRLPGAYVVPPGEYQLRLERPSGLVLADRTVQLLPGQQLELEQLTREAAPARAALRLGPRLGYQTSLGRTRANALFDSAPLFGAAVHLALPRPWQLYAGVTYTAGSHQAELQGRSGSYAATEFQNRELAGALGLTVGWSPGRLELCGGPRVQLLWFDRRFGPTAQPRQEQGLAFGPGLGAGLAISLTRQLALTLEADGYYLPLAVDDQASGLLRGAVHLGLDWRAGS